MHTEEADRGNQHVSVVMDVVRPDGGSKLWRMMLDIV
jgi:hypothetical protein